MLRISNIVLDAIIGFCLLAFLILMAIRLGFYLTGYDPKERIKMEGFEYGYQLAQGLNDISLDLLVLSKTVPIAEVPKVQQITSQVMTIRQTLKDTPKLKGKKVISNIVLPQLEMITGMIPEDYPADWNKLRHDIRNLSEKAR